MISMTFRGQTEEIKKSTSAVQDYITKLGESGSISKTLSLNSETISGKETEIGNQWSEFKKNLGEVFSPYYNALLDISKFTLGIMNNTMKDSTSSTVKKAEAETSYDITNILQNRNKKEDRISLESDFKEKYGSVYNLWAKQNKMPSLESYEIKNKKGNITDIKEALYTTFQSFNKKEYSKEEKDLIKKGLMYDNSDKTNKFGVDFKRGQDYIILEKEKETLKEELNKVRKSNDFYKVKQLEKELKENKKTMKLLGKPAKEIAEEIMKQANKGNIPSGSEIPGKTTSGTAQQLINAAPKTFNVNIGTLMNIEHQENMTDGNIKQFEQKLKNAMLDALSTISAQAHTI
jgi:hypothetical protein